MHRPHNDVTKMKSFADAPEASKFVFSIFFVISLTGVSSGFICLNNVKEIENLYRASIEF